MVVYDVPKYVYIIDNNLFYYLQLNTIETDDKLLKKAVTFLWTSRITPSTGCCSN